MEDEIQDAKLMEVYDKDVIDAIKGRMKRTQLGKFYRQDECISVLSEQIYRFHLGGKSVDEILAFINDDLKVVRKEDILRVIREHDAKPRKRRSRKPLSASKSEAKPDISELKPKIPEVKPLDSEVKPPVSRDLIEAKPLEKGSRPDIRSPLKMRTHKSETGSEELR